MSADIQDADFTTLIRVHSKHDPDVFDKAIGYISSLRSGPSCARFATATLLRSCQDVEGAVQSTRDDTESFEVTLDQLKSTYAARLAVCELIEAGASVPSECSSLTPAGRPRQERNLARILVRKTTMKSQDGMPNPDGATLKQCLTSLESRPQWWTSYSNNRQNAVVMCQAVRGQIERGL